MIIFAFVDLFPRVLPDIQGGSEPPRVLLRLRLRLRSCALSAVWTLPYLESALGVVPSLTPQFVQLVRY